ncbi:hypothetical protein MPSEU_000072300 [Mayamaea pseudoterrestris]|nr:hypothetical protein MPSEU_000072300 [Mayamaea pseudoterrestris]
MFGGILRRVISNPDNMDDEGSNNFDTNMRQQLDEADDDTDFDGNIVIIDTSEVSNLQTNLNAPMTLIHSRSNSSAMSGSTLSEDDHELDIRQGNDADGKDDNNQTMTDNSTHNNDAFPHRHIRRADSEELSQRAMSSQNSSRDWGWFEDVHQQGGSSSHYKASKRKHQRGDECSIDTDSDVGQLMMMRDLNPEDSAAAMAVTAPTYVLEESLSSQHLWKRTAGQRPPQPIEERAFYEKMWAQNFYRSQVDYAMPSEVLTAVSPISLSPWTDGNFSQGNTADLEHYSGLLASGTSSKRHHSAAEDGEVAEAALVSRMNQDSHEISEVINRRVHGSEGDLIILVRGDNVFGTTVSKSFVRFIGQQQCVDTVNVSIASYRVVESPHHGKYAQFLVIYREGSIQDTIGVWKRYRDFEELARRITFAHEGCKALVSNMSPLAVTEEPETEHLPNAIMSWRLLQKRKRWYRCLDAGYLSLKVFLLERFLHDILFESTSPKVLREFVGPTAL